MAISTQSSLFEPSAASPMATSVSWINSVLFSEIALGICVLAVAFLGVLMLTGRLPLRGGVRVLLGCFVVLGAPVIASSLITVGLGSSSYESLVTLLAAERSARETMPPSDYNPYARASLRGDQ